MSLDVATTVQAYLIASESILESKVFELARCDMEKIPLKLQGAGDVARMIIERCIPQWKQALDHVALSTPIERMVEVISVLRGVEEKASLVYLATVPDNDTLLNLSENIFEDRAQQLGLTVQDIYIHMQDILESAVDETTNVDVEMKEESSL